MKAVAAAAMLVVLGTGLLGCDPNPRALPCMTYVAGGFNRENGFAFALDAKDWPLLDGTKAQIEISFLFSGDQNQKVDLVHVAGDHELERWSLEVPTERGKLPVCLITASPATSTCGASVRVLPHDVGGYWYLRGGDNLLEAGMSVVLCKVANPATP